jgi:hypothetical protein
MPITKATASSIAPAAKGDLVVGSATNDASVLAVGNNGDTLLADSSATTGLRWQGNFAAGKNKIINGDFGIWQRGTSFTTGNGVYAYTADRWRVYFYGSNTASVTQQTFTPGTAPIAGYEGQYFARVSSSNTQIVFEQLIEDVRTFAGQTVTLSFWAKQNTAAANALSVNLYQNFGSGGSPQVTVPALSSTSTTTSWARYTATVAIPSISGKTVGTSSYLLFGIYSSSLNNALDIWGIQLEAGNTATAFQTATGTLAGELAACQRYYIRYTGPASYPTFASKGVSSSTTLAYFWIDHPVELRTAATSIEYATLGAYNFTPNIYALTNLVLDNCNSKVTKLAATTSGMTANHFMVLVGNNTSAAYLGINAEL